MKHPYGDLQVGIAVVTVGAPLVEEIRKSPAEDADQGKKEPAHGLQLRFSRIAADAQPAHSMADFSIPRRQKQV